MAQYTGIVENIVEKDTKVGKMYDVMIGGEKFGVGKFIPKGVGIGDTVEYDVEFNGNFKNIARNSMKKTAPSAVSGGQPVGNRPAAAPATAFVDTKQDTIAKQSAFNTAIAFLKLAQDSGALPMPTSKAQGFGYLRSLLHTEAATFYGISTGKEWEFPDTDVKAEAPKPVRKPKAPAPAPEPEETDEWEDDEEIGF